MMSAIDFGLETWTTDGNKVFSLGERVTPSIAFDFPSGYSLVSKNQPINV